MSSMNRRRGLRTLVILLFVLALVPGLAASAVCADEGKRVLKVMTYNMDAGTDFLYLIALPDEDVTRAVQLTYEEVAGTDFQGRAALLAKQIAAEQPDLVSLQEVTLWELTAGGQQVQLIADQLALLLAALEAKGSHYKVVATNALTDLAVPTDDSGTVCFRFLDRDVILARSGGEEGALEWSNIRVRTYESRIELLGMFEQVNGWMSVDVKVGPGTVRFFATHLEAPVSAEDTTQIGQGQELIARMNESPFPVVAAGDFNSDASGAGLGPDLTPTAGMIAGAGYVEVWQALRAGQPGFTWPLYYEDLWPGRDYFPGPERIDLVFTKGLRPLTIRRTGTAEPFPSDHAGVVAMLLLEK